MRVVCPSRELSLLPPAASWSFETQVLIDSMTGKVNFLTKLLGDISVRRVFSLSFHHVIFFPQLIEVLFILGKGVHCLHLLCLVCQVINHWVDVQNGYSSVTPVGALYEHLFIR